MMISPSLDGVLITVHEGGYRTGQPGRSGRERSYQTEGVESEHALVY
jgi:hypothetical protein